MSGWEWTAMRDLDDVERENELRTTCSRYTQTRNELTIDIREAIAAKGYAAVGIAARNRTLCILVAPAERQAAAQALAGDGYDVVERLAEWERELLDKQTRIDPADVKVGDVVEISHSGPPPWRLEGTVIDQPAPSGLTLPPHDLWVSFKPGGELLMPRDATVRLVRRAEPEPDPVQVEALWNLGHQLGASRGEPLLSHDEAAELIRRGVTVRKDT